MRVRLHRFRLDRELASGCDCTQSDAVCLRALQLAAPRTRRRLARGLRRVAATDPYWPRPRSAGIFIPPEVGPWREALAGLAERLEQAPAINPCGIARALELLTDGAGPLYSSTASMRIGEAVWWVADGLQVIDDPDLPDSGRRCPPHAWGCPVIMKLDPGHVAWTCARCGAIAMTEDSAVRPA